MDINQVLTDEDKLTVKGELDTYMKCLENHTFELLEAMQILEDYSDEDSDSEQVIAYELMDSDEEEPEVDLRQYILDIQMVQEVNEDLAHRVLELLESNDNANNTIGFVTALLEHDENDEPPNPIDYFRNMISIYNDNTEHINALIGMMQSVEVVEQKDEDELNQDNNEENENTEEVEEKKMKMDV